MVIVPSTEVQDGLFNRLIIGYQTGEEEYARSVQKEQIQTSCTTCCGHKYSSWKLL